MRRLFEMLLLFLAFPAPVLYAAPGITQNTVDSLVDRAYYVLTSVDDPGSGMTGETAVRSARAIAVKLRAMAEGDPNRGYILGKAKELEGQIYLEERGLLLEKDRFRQKSVNDLIASFNAELGRNRPSFRRLRSFQEQMEAVKPGAGIDVEKAITKRGQSLGREIPAALQAALEKGRLDSARSELVYCEVNRDDLDLSTARYAALEARVSARMNDDDERALVRKSLDGLKAALAKNDLALARRENGFSGRRIRSLRSRLVPFEWNRLNSEYELLYRKLSSREDSLVDAALTFLRRNGPAAAERQLDAMKTAGVSPERIGMVDRAILETVIRQKTLEAERDTSLLTAVDDSGTAAFALADMIASAKKRAAEKKDSAAGAFALASRSTHVNDVRKDRLRIAYELQQLRTRDKKITEKEQALQELVDIYRFLELQKTQDAYQKLIYVKTLLKNNIPLEDYDKVTAAVKQQYEKGK
ncbi:MAG: hypothetical protein JXA71_08150 [Chitinispirillaceae bacterium]|nr:hypothetical protein [Chitinispirillaceae bacterium]